MYPNDFTLHLPFLEGRDTRCPRPRMKSGGMSLKRTRLDENLSISTSVSLIPPVNAGQDDMLIVFRSSQQTDPIQYNVLRNTGWKQVHHRNESTMTINQPLNQFPHPHPLPGKQGRLFFCRGLLPYKSACQCDGGASEYFRNFPQISDSLNFMSALG